MLSYRAPAIAALAAIAGAQCVPGAGTRAVDPDARPPGLTAVMVDVATNVLTFTEDAKLGTYLGEHDRPRAARQRDARDVT